MQHAEITQWIEYTNALQREIHVNAVEHGFWPPDGRNDGECIALMHSELSEALEAMRDGDSPSRKAAGFSKVEEELADVVIRILDYAGGNGLDIASALIAKIQYNRNRPIKHGREF